MATGQKTGGRKKGTPNKKTTEVRDKISDLLGQYKQDQMVEDFMELRAGERLKLFASLSEFLAPKLNRTTVEADEPEPAPDETTDYSRLSTADKIQMLKLIRKAKGEKTD